MTPEVQVSIEESRLAKLAIALTDVRRRSECMHGRPKRIVALPRVDTHTGASPVPVRRYTKKRSMKAAPKKAPETPKAEALKNAEKPAQIDPLKAKRLSLLKEAGMRIQAKLGAKQK